MAFEKIREKHPEFIDCLLALDHDSEASDYITSSFNQKLIMSG